MIILNQTDTFSTWVRHLSNSIAKARVAARLNGARHGNFGDHKSVGHGLMEMRIDTGPGYRIYYVQEETQVYLLLAGGDKSTQERDIRKAFAIWNEIKEKGNG